MDPYPSRVARVASLFLLLGLLFGCKGEKPWTGWWTPGDSVDNVGYKPEQPIAFSHNLHAGKMKMDCQYCHSSARRSSSAGVPSSNVCMGCHKLAKTDAPDIKFLTEKYEKNEPIEWTKVHDLPDYVRFSHRAHVERFGPLTRKEGAKESAEVCANCHGDMKKETVAKQNAPLQMGWCIDCHVTNEAPTSCNTCHY